MTGKKSDNGRENQRRKGYDPTEDQVLRRMLETPPRPRKAGGKKNKGDGRRLRTSQRKR